MPRIFTIVSVILHAMLVGSALVAQVLAVGPLPIPRQPLAFARVTPIAIVEPPPPPRSSSPRTDRLGPAPGVPPVVPPQGNPAGTPVGGSGPTLPVLPAVGGGRDKPLQFGHAPLPPPPHPRARPPTARL